MPGDQVDVHVEDGLPARCSVRLEQRHAVGPKAFLQERRDVMDRAHHVRGFFSADVPDVSRVTARHDERMPGHCRETVENTNRVLVLIDLPRALFSRRDPAEEAPRRCVGHPRMVQDRC